jgi:putative FmdB family regulatory protein
MPIYEYRCTACNHQFELRQKFTDAPADQCPKCGGAVHKMVSASAFSLKGGGWYGDNYDAKAEAPKTESNSAIGAETAADSAPTDSTTKETTASPATSSVKSQSETKSSVAEKPAASEKPNSEKNEPAAEK